MLDRPLSRVTDVRKQSFSVAYDYSVAFTHDAFTPGNRCLIDVLTRREPDKRHRCAVFIDEGVFAAMSDLLQRITEYAAVHAQSIEIVGVPITVAGGESVAFFESVLFSRETIQNFAVTARLSASQAEALLRRHLGICYDVCHGSVEYEAPVAALDRLMAAGIAIPKIQLSAAMRGRHRSSHLEVETYTWDVLPESLRTGSKASNIAREIAFCAKELVG